MLNIYCKLIAIFPSDSSSTLHTREPRQGLELELEVSEVYVDGKS